MSTSDHPAPARAPHTGVAVAMLLAGVALIGYAIYPLVCIESVNRWPEVKSLAQPNELAARKRDIIGTYATGTQPGDRMIIVGADATARFYEIGARGPIDETKDGFRIGRHEGQLCLATQGSGIIDVEEDGTLVYFRDRYQRPK